MKNPRRPLQGLARYAMGLVLAGSSLAATADDGASLRAKYGELGQALRSNAYHQPIHIDSAEAGNTLQGDVYALLPHSFDRFSAAMKDPADWCAIMLLPFNTKYCHAVDTGNGTTLQVRIGRKFDQPVEQAYRIDFAFRPQASGKDFFESLLEAKSGPVGTRDYRIVVSAVPVDGGKTFMHLSYSYGYGMTGRFAMQAYLSTAGADKVGFTVVGRDGNGQPAYIGGVRGAIERNAMRYYLAINAHMASLSAPQGQRVDKRIQAWFDSTEKYPRQLREMDRSTYVAMKRGEFERQQTAIQ